MQMISRFVKCDAGATAIEYGLLASLIGVAIIGALTSLSSSISTTFTNVGANLN